MKTTTNRTQRFKPAYLISGMAALALAFAALFASQQVNAAGYEKIESLQNTSVSDKVEVLEYFWLGCPHCYSFEPTIEAWKKDAPDYVHFIREAPPLNPSWEAHSLGFYAAQFLGKEDEFVEAMFEAIHVKKQNMRNPKKIAELAEELGMDKKVFESTMKSFAVVSKMNQAKAIAIQAGISSVPSIVVNGKYRTGPSVAGGNAGVIDTINELVEVERKAMGLE